MNPKKKKKVLIITYYWPPSGGPGVQRVLKFAKYLIREGWDVVVLTVKNGEYPAIDKNLIKEIPRECKIYQTKSIEFFSLFKMLTGKKKDSGIDTFVLDKKNVSIFGKIAKWIRLNLFIPDGRLGWKYYAISKGKNIIDDEKPDIIFSSSPPHSLQIIANKLAQYSKLPWVADFRDPWTQAFWDKGLKRIQWATNKNIKLETHILKSATKVISVSQGVLDILPIANRNKTVVIPNGFDKDDFKTNTNPPNNKFTIVYMGHMAHSQCPILFIKAISNLPSAILNHLKVDLYGKQDQYFWEIVNEYNMGHLFKNHGYVSHNIAISKMQSADCLLLLIPKNFGKGILTGKLFEYLASDKFILGFGDIDGDAADLLETCLAGKMVSYESNPTDIIEERWKAWKENIVFQPNKTEISKFTRHNLTKSLIKTLESCL